MENWPDENYAHLKEEFENYSVEERDMKVVRRKIISAQNKAILRELRKRVGDRKLGKFYEVTAFVGDDAIL